MKRIVIGCLLALLIPYIVTLAWTGTIQGEEKKTEAHSDRRILLDRGDSGIYMDVEEYLIGVVAKQIPADYGEEALKAQAIIARTYIYKQMGEEREIAESALDMDYLEEKQLEDLWGTDFFVTYYRNVEQAVEGTASVVITYDGSCIDPLFHRASTGNTRAGDDRHPYLQSVESQEDVEAEDYLSIITFTKEEFVGRINEIPKADKTEQGDGLSTSQVPESIQMVARDLAGYVNQIQIGSRTYTGEEVQHALGLSSSSFVLEEYEGKIRAVCKGIGHGYGLSQQGARGKAKEGWKAEDILNYYYKGITLTAQ